MDILNAAPHDIRGLRFAVNPESRYGISGVR